MKNKRAILILVLALVIGFASISTTLVLNGVIGISNKKDDFKVIFESAMLDGEERQELIDDTTKQTINYETKTLTAVNETTTLEYVVANTSRLYDAEVVVSCTPENNEYISIEYTPKSMTVEAGKTKSGSITTKLIKSSAEEQSISITCELNANATERDTLGSEYIPPKQYELTVDNNNNGIPDVGDEIQVGTESFYVISHTDTELNALAKYNLNVGSNKNPNITEGIQQSGDNFVVVFSNNNTGWPTVKGVTIDIKSYDGPVKEALYGENGYAKYIQEIIPKVQVRLITMNELIELGCSSNNKTCSGAPNWVFSTLYWSQTAYTGSNSTVWTVGSRGFFDDRPFNEGFYGVRPVITIPKL